MYDGDVSDQVSVVCPIDWTPHQSSSPLSNRHRHHTPLSEELEVTQFYGPSPHSRTGPRSSPDSGPRPPVSTTEVRRRRCRPSDAHTLSGPVHTLSGSSVRFPGSSSTTLKSAHSSTRDCLDSGDGEVGRGMGRKGLRDPGRASRVPGTPCATETHVSTFHKDHNDVCQEKCVRFAGRKPGNGTDRGTDLTTTDGQEGVGRAESEPRWSDRNPSSLTVRGGRLTDVAQ